jgi:hypothetical protein
VGLGAFIASLRLDWVRFHLAFNVTNNTAVPDSAVTFGVASSTLTVVYELGVMALLALLGSVLLRPALASRLRLAATALGVGVLGVVAAAAAQLRGSVDQFYSALGIGAGYSVSSLDFGGTYVAGGAVVALVAGVWLAAVPRPQPSAPEMTPVERSPGWLARLVGGQAAIVAFVAAVVGAGTLVASMLLTWQSVSLYRNPIVPAQPNGLLTLSLSDTRSGVVFLLGALVLLGLLGAVVSRPDLAARLRPGGLGFGLGLAGVLVATVFEMRDWNLQRVGALIAPVISDDQRGQINTLSFSLHSGLYLGFVALFVLIGGFWLAGASTRAPAAPEAPHAAESYAAAPSGYVLVPVSAVLTGISSAVPTLPVPTSPVPISPAPISPLPTPPVPTPPGLAAALQPTAEPQPAPAPAPTISGPAANWLGPVGYADGLTVTASDVIDIGPQSDILRS